MYFPCSLLIRLAFLVGEVRGETTLLGSGLRFLFSLSSLICSGSSFELKSASFSFFSSHIWRSSRLSCFIKPGLGSICISKILPWPVCVEDV
jgi:hypothetical protein